MAKRIFISYRRNDNKAMAGWLGSRLRQEFGKRQVFLDVDNLAGGDEFQIEIEGVIRRRCRVFLPVIGPGWLSEENRKRLGMPQDYVRLEMLAALENKRIRVIPVLLDDTLMPPPEHLPKELVGLCSRNAHLLRHASFEADTRTLSEVIDPFVRTGLIARLRRRLQTMSFRQRIAATLSLVSAISLVAILIWPRARARPSIAVLDLMDRSSSPGITFRAQRLGSARLVPVSVAVGEGVG